MGDPLKHSRFYMTTVTFLVGDCLFRVPRGPFETESTVFRDMFLLPAGDQNTVEGSSDGNPIRLEGIKQDDFEQLLKVLFTPSYGEAQELPEGIEQWTSVLNLSTRWEFWRTRQKAIEELEAIPISPIDKVLLANLYGVTEWWLPAMNKLAQRPEPISMEDAKRLGFETALKLASVREHLALHSTNTSSTRCSCGRSSYNTKLIVGSRDPAAQELDFTPVLRTVFDLAESPRSGGPSL